MIKLQETYLTALLSMLDRQGAQYRIEMPDGTVHGTLEVKARKSPISRKPLTFPRGTVLAHYLPFVEGMQAGDAVAIPCVTDTFAFDPAALRSSVSSYCTRTWGVNASMTSVNRNDNTVEVVRIS